MKVVFQGLPAVPRNLEEFGSVVSSTLRALTDVVNGRVSLGDVQPGSANIDGNPIEVADTGSANVEFVLSHNLGRVPVFYLYNISITGYVYDSQRSLWTNETFRLKCSAANAALKIFVFG